MTMQDVFSQDLRSERERRGVTLEQIVQSTKVRRPLLAALEAGDVSKLPSGIYARGMLRGYAKAVGLPAEPLLAQFSQLCSEPERVGAAGDPSPSGMRLSLEPEPRWNPRSVCNMLAAVADTCAVLLGAGVIAQFTGANQCAGLLRGVDRVHWPEPGLVVCRANGVDDPAQDVVRDDQRRALTESLRSDDVT